MWIIIIIIITFLGLYHLKRVNFISSAASGSVYLKAACYCGRQKTTGTGFLPGRYLAGNVAFATSLVFSSTILTSSYVREETR
jgi:hypothetical protein